MRCGSGMHFHYFRRGKPQRTSQCAPFHRECGAARKTSNRKGSQFICQKLVSRLCVWPPSPHSPASLALRHFHSFTRLLHFPFYPVNAIYSLAGTQTRFNNLCCSDTNFSSAPTKLCLCEWKNSKVFVRASKRIQSVCMSANSIFGLEFLGRCVFSIDSLVIAIK